jgi:Tfp pilus assembly protein PilV
MPNPVFAVVEMWRLKKCGVAQFCCVGLGRKRLRVHQQGFALVVTLLLMILLTVIAVGLLSLSTISLRSSTHAKDQAEARANAKLAMMLAIAQVQEQFGKDQAISAQAAMLDSDPASPKTAGVNGVANPHWLGAYSPLNPSDGRFFIRRPSDTTPGGNVFLYDSRYSDSSGNSLTMATGNETSYPAGRAYNRTAPYNVKWLVSDPNCGSATLADHANPLTWNGSLTTAQPKARPDKAELGVVLYPKVTGSSPDYVPISKVNGVAPIVPLVNKDGGGASRRTGSYAYMVSDNSQKFKVNPQHVGDPADKAPQDYTRLKAPADVHLEGTHATAPELKLRDIQITRQSVGGIVSLPNLALAANPKLSSPTVFSRPLQHSLTTQGYGLFTNPVVGGLRKNLTAFLETKGTGTVSIQSPGTRWKKDDAISDYQPMLASLTDLNSAPQDSISSSSYGLPDSVCPSPRSVSFAALTNSTDTGKRFLWFSPVMGQLRDYVQLGRDTNRYGSSGASIPTATPSTAVMMPRAGSGDGGAIDDRNISVAGLKAPQTTWDASTSSSPNTNTDSHVSTPDQAPRSGCHPVITKAALHMHLAYDDEHQQVVYLLFPRVELYNPYNVTMKGMTYIVSIASLMNKRFQIDKIEFRDPTTNTVMPGIPKTPMPNPTNPADPANYNPYFNCNLVTSANAGLLSNNSPPLANSEFVFVLEAKDIPPGKTLLFRPDPTISGNIADNIGGGKVPKYYWHRSLTMAGASITSMTLTADSTKLPVDDNTSCYWIEPNAGNYKGIPANWDPQYAYSPAAPNSESTGVARYTKLYLVSNGVASIPSGYHGTYITDSSKFPLLQMQCTMMPRNGTHFWKSYGQIQLDTVSDAIENVSASRLHWWTIGIRWGKFEESPLYVNTAGTQIAIESAYYPLLAQYNIRAPYSSMFAPDKAGDRIRTSSGQVVGGNDQDFKTLPWLLPVPTNAGGGEDPLNLGDNQAIPSGGGATVNPFFRTGTSGNINATPLFEVARESLPILGLAEFRNTSLLPFVQFPSYLVGESLASVFAPRTHTTYTTDYMLNNMYIGFSGTGTGTCPVQWMSTAVPNAHRGYTNPYMKYNGSDTWIGHNYLQAYDASYELNYSLWDRYFLTGLIGDHTGGGGSAAAGLLPSASGDTTAVDPAKPLKSNNSLAYNPRIVPNTSSGVVKKEDVVSYHKAGGKLLLDGAFNVNSTDPLAWQALLLSFRGVESPSIAGSPATSADRTAFGKLLYPYLNNVTPGQPQDISDPNAWQALRSLSDTDVQALAASIVEQVKRRGPFISLSDFVNRRLVGGSSNDFGSNSETLTSPTAATFPTEPSLGLAGPLQAALDSIDYSDRSFSETSQNSFLTEAAGATLTVNSIANTPGTYTQHNPIARGAYMPGHLTQGDLLTKIGPLLTVRGDSYTIRSYGDSRDPSGNITAHARCEVVIQRVPDFVETVSPSGTVQQPQLEALDPELSAVNKKFGRKFNIVSFRWLADAEIN